MSEAIKQRVYAALARDEWRPLLKIFETLEVLEGLPRAEIALAIEEGISTGSVEQRIGKRREFRLME